MSNINNNRMKLNPIRWDAHGCPPFKMGSDLSFLSRYKKQGLNFISINVGFDLRAQAETLQFIEYFHQWVKQHDEEYSIIKNTQQIFENQLNNKLSIAFDIEGCNLLNDKIEMVSYFYELGVRQMLFSYNNNNSAGGGCFDVDIGLTKFGKDLVKECNTVGMMIDCSHVGYKTSMDIMALSEHPVVFSHSNSAKLVDHPRNISDEQIIACAKTGGVIGINGIGIFLGNNDISSERIVEHIDYVVQKVGIEHVGIGLDCVFNLEEAKILVKNNPDVFPVKYGFDDVAVAQPEQFSEIENLLIKQGYSDRAINNILGENFLRVAQHVWK